MKLDKQYVPFGIIFLYTAINLYIAALNWDVFTTVLNMEMGFGKVSMPPFVFLFFIGFILMLVLWFYEYRKDMKHQMAFMESETKLNLLQKDIEIESLKSKTHTETAIVKKTEELIQNSEVSDEVEKEVS